MTLFIDASALVSILCKEPDAAELEARIDAAPRRLTSAIALWEVSRAVERLTENDSIDGLIEAERYCASLGITVVPIGTAEAREAVRAQARYGKGSRHLARLNMGDCFAYACAKANGAKLLYKGDDFTHTDLA